MGFSFLALIFDVWDARQCRGSQTRRRLDMWVHTHRSFRILPLILAFTVGLALTPPKMWAQAHDFAVIDVWAEPDPLDCPSTVSVTLLILGDLDWQFVSGAVSVDFKYQKDGGTWQPVGSLEVTRAPSDVAFAKWQSWPASFLSHPTNGVEFMPLGAGNYRFSADVIYPPGTPPEPGGYQRTDHLESDTYSTDGCAPSVGQIGSDCILVQSTTPDGRAFCLEDLPKLIAVGEEIRDLLCDGRLPEAPQPPECRGGIAPICQLVPCPVLFTRPLEILFDDRLNSLNLSIVNQDGKRVAVAERLRIPIREGERLFTKRLTFQPSRDQTYYLAFWPGTGTRRGVILPFDVRVRESRRGE
jgi:hypothetical protein